MEARLPRSSANRGFLGQALVIGKLAGTEVRLHWTFLAYLAWLGIAFLVTGGASAALSGVGLVIAVFGCVLAHEFGHILTARSFGLETPDVTLLPIGGLARLQGIPKRPAQELAVALAGPAVNLAIAALLVMLPGVDLAGAEHAAVPTSSAMLPALATINLFLALFNLLPAFPMDGGRVVRALLAMVMDHGRATRVAASLGHALAIGLALLGLSFENAILVLIAGFVCLAASAEARDVRLHGVAARRRVADAMITEMTPVSAESSLAEAVQMLVRSGQRQFPVLDRTGQITGVLTRDGIVRTLRAAGAELSVSRAMAAEPVTVSADSPLEDALPIIAGAWEPVLVERDGQVVGMITPDALENLLLLPAVPGRGRQTSSPAGRTILARENGSRASALDRAGFAPARSGHPDL